MAYGLTFRLEHEDGRPTVDPPRCEPPYDVQAGDTIPLGRDRILRVTEVRTASDFGESPVEAA